MDAASPQPGAGTAPTCTDKAAPNLAEPAWYATINASAGLDHCVAVTSDGRGWN